MSLHLLTKDDEMEFTFCMDFTLFLLPPQLVFCAFALIEPNLCSINAKDRFDKIRSQPHNLYTCYSAYQFLDRSSSASPLAHLHVGVDFCGYKFLMCHAL